MTGTAKPRIAVVGSNMVDLVTYVKRMPVRGETVEAPSFEMGHGGKGANQAVAAAKLGASVIMVTAVGDDMFADNTIRNLAGPRRRHNHVRRVPANRAASRRSWSNRRAKTRSSSSRAPTQNSRRPTSKRRRTT